MTDTTERPLTLGELQTEACMLASLIEGLDVLNDASDPGSHRSEDIVQRRASNAMGPLIEAAIKAAWELTNRIEIFENMQRKARTTEVAQ